jgi:hypothetical protein
MWVSTFSSVRVKPRPARSRRLYLIVGHRTTGLSLSTGRGATAAAFAARTDRRRIFWVAYCHHLVSERRQMIIISLPICLWNSYLVEVASNPALPVLAEIYDHLSVSRAKLPSLIGAGSNVSTSRGAVDFRRTVLLNLVVVLDRLCTPFSSASNGTRNFHSRTP